MKIKNLHYNFGSTPQKNKHINIFTKDWLTSLKDLQNKRISSSEIIAASQTNVSLPAPKGNITTKGIKMSSYRKININIHIQNI